MTHRPRAVLFPGGGGPKPPRPASQRLHPAHWTWLVPFILCWLWVAQTMAVDLIVGRDFSTCWPKRSEMSGRPPECKVGPQYLWELL
jgi:hypothetical protein